MKLNSHKKIVRKIKSKDHAILEIFYVNKLGNLITRANLRAKSQEPGC